MTEYNFTPPAFTAIKWDGSNTEDVLSFIEGSATFAVFPGGGEGVLHAVPGGTLIIGVNSWIIKTYPSIFMLPGLDITLTQSVINGLLVVDDTTFTTIFSEAS